MKNFANSDFRNKLNKVLFTSVDDVNQVLYGDILGHKVKLSLSINVAESYELERKNVLAFQGVFRLLINGEYIQSWGACTQEDNMQIVKFYSTLKAKLLKDEEILGRRNRKDMENLFDSL